MKLICTLFLSALTPLLWAQAILIKDIHEGGGDGIPDWYEDNAVLGDIMIFAADNGAVGSELYKLESGTVTLVKDILEGEKGSEPLRFITFFSLEKTTFWITSILSLMVRWKVQERSKHPNVRIRVGIFSQKIMLFIFFSELSTDLQRHLSK